MTDKLARPAETPEALFARFRERGEVEALGELFDRVSPTLFRMALALAPDAASAEDAVQEAFLTLMAPTTHYDPSRPLVPWMVGILQMKVHEVRRRVRRAPDPSRLPPPMFPEDPAAAAETGEEVERVRQALDALPEPYRAVAILRWRYGLEPAAIADSRSESPGTTRSLLHRAQERLRRALRVLPAFVAGSRPPRGIDSVRDAVLSRAAVVAAATAAGALATGTASSLTLGGVLVSGKALAASAAALLLGGLGWLALRPATVPDTATPPVPRAAAPAPAPPSTPPPAAEVSATSGSAGPEFPPPVDLSKCDRDLDLFGTTVDESGRPVPGALVEIVRYPWRRSGLAPPGSYELEETGLSTRSAVDGTFALRLARGEMVDLRAAADGHGQGEIAQCIAGERVRLVLRKGGAAVRVLAVDEQRRPVEGARVRFEMQSTDSVHGRRALSREGKTDASGRCGFLHLPGGKASLRLDHPVLGQPGWQQPTVPEAGSLDVEFVLPRGRMVTGRVADSATGVPIPGARVGSNWVMDRPVETDRDGRFAFPGWTGKGTSILTAAAAGYASERKKVAEVGDVDFTLERAFRATGRVLSADGSPVAGARVTASGYWEEGERSGADRSAATTDAEGTFVLADLSRRTRHGLVAEAAGHGRVALSFEAPDAEEEEKQLGHVILTASRAIEGRALDPDGKPLQGRDVNLARLLPPDDPAWREPRGSGAVAGMGELRRTDDLGRFRFPDLSPGRWGLKLVVPGSPIVEKTVDLPADRDVLDVVLAEQGRSLTFLVTDPEGRPLPEINVMSHEMFPHPSSGIGGQTNLQGATDAAGRVEFRSLPLSRRGTGGLVFTVQPIIGEKAPPWAAHRTEPLVPEGQEVRIVLQPVAWIRGTVRGPEDEVVPGLYVTAVDERGESVAGASGACGKSGEFAVRIPAGRTVTLKVPGHRSVDSGKGYMTVEDTGYRGELEGVAASTSGILLRVRRLSSNQSLDILVLDLEGQPVPGVQLYASGPLVSNREGKTDVDGRIRWEQLLEESWTVTPPPTVPEGMAEDVVPPAKIAVVPRGQEVVLRFRRGVVVEGVVLKPDDSPAPGAVLIYNLEGGGGAGARPPKVGEDGRFRVYFGEGDRLRLSAGWTDGNGGSFLGETDVIEIGRSGPVEIRLRAQEAR